MHMDDHIHISILAALNGKKYKKTYIQVHKTLEADEQRWPKGIKRQVEHGYAQDVYEYFKKWINNLTKN